MLEEYLADFRGCVIVVSHDRYFMDKVVDHLLVFKGDGVVDDFPGNYSQYRDYLQIKEKEEVRERKEQRTESTDSRKTVHEGSNRRRKLTFKDVVSLNNSKQRLNNSKLKRQPSTTPSLLDPLLSMKSRSCLSVCPNSKRN